MGAAFPNNSQNGDGFQGAGARQGEASSHQPCRGCFMVMRFHEVFSALFRTFSWEAFEWQHRVKSALATLPLFTISQIREV